jgi:predicted component of type VI protein secretion system
MSKLVISGIAHDLAEDFITIGRGRDNTIIINHPSVSTRHAQLQRDGEIYRLKDFNSTNGTRVNGIPVTESILRAGDLIQFGAAEARYESPDVATSRPSPPLEPVEIKAAELGLVSPELTAVPVDFANASPFPHRKEEKDPVRTAIHIGLAIVLLVFLGSMVAVLIMHAPAL